MGFTWCSLVLKQADGLLQGAKDAVSGLTQVMLQVLICVLSTDHPQVVDQQSAEASTLIASGADGGSSLQEVTIRDQSPAQRR